MEESRGLGDTIKKVTEAIGLRPCGGCQARAQILNRLFPYRRLVPGEAESLIMSLLRTELNEEDREFVLRCRELCVSKETLKVEDQAMLWEISRQSKRAI